MMEANNLEWRATLDTSTGGEHDVYESYVVGR